MNTSHDDDNDDAYPLTKDVCRLAGVAKNVSQMFGCDTASSI